MSIVTEIITFTLGILITLLFFLVKDYLVFYPESNYTIDGYYFTFKDNLISDNKSVDGYTYSNNSIYIDTHLSQPLYKVCVHEILHNLLTIKDNILEEEQIQKIDNKIKIDTCDKLLEKVKENQQE